MIPCKLMFRKKGISDLRKIIKINLELFQKIFEISHYRKILRNVAQNND